MGGGIAETDSHSKGLASPVGCLGTEVCYKAASEVCVRVCARACTRGERHEFSQCGSVCDCAQLLGKGEVGCMTLGGLMAVVGLATPGGSGSSHTPAFSDILRERLVPSSALPQGEL